MEPELFTSTNSECETGRGFLSLAQKTNLAWRRAGDETSPTQAMQLTVSNLSIYASGFLYLVCCVGASRAVVAAGVDRFVPLNVPVGRLVYVCRLHSGYYAVLI